MFLKRFKKYCAPFIYSGFLMCCPLVYGQEIEVEDHYDEFFGKKPALIFTIRSDANLNDASLGTAVGWMNKSRNWSLFGSFDARPFRRRTLLLEGNNTYYQYREERYFVGGGRGISAAVWF